MQEMKSLGGRVLGWALDVFSLETGPVGLLVQSGHLDFQVIKLYLHVLDIFHTLLVHFFGYRELFVSHIDLLQIEQYLIP